MLREHALRYLLARQIWAAHDHVRPQLFEEVSNSLTVSREGAEYTVRWTREGAEHDRRYAAQDFIFYRKGDADDSDGARFLAERQNVERARTFAAEALGLPDSPGSFEPPALRVQPVEVMAFIWIFVLGAALFLVDSERLFAFAVALTIASIVEYVPGVGRLLASLCLVGFILAGFPLSGAVAGAAYAAMHALDPNPQQRLARIAVSLGAVAYAFASVSLSDLDTRSLLLGVVCSVVVLPIVVARWTVGRHQRALPLVVPFLAVGLAAEGATGAAVVIVLNAMLCLVGRMYGWRLFAHPNAATFQGVSKTTHR